MADDHYQTEHHLTRSGWIEGTTRFFGRVQGPEVARPEGAVATFECEVYQRSRWSGEERTWKKLWQSPQVKDEEMECLLKQFPRQK